MRKTRFVALALASVSLVGCANRGISRESASAADSVSGAVSGFGRKLELRRRGDAEWILGRLRALTASLSIDDKGKSLYALTASGEWPRYLLPNDEVSFKDLKLAIPYLIACLEEGRDEDFLELHASLLMSFRDPLQRVRSIEASALRAWNEHTTSPFMKGRTPATNSGASAESDPADGGFWAKPRDLARRDLATGFGRATTLRARTRDGALLCDYDEMKTGYGTSPGFTAKCRLEAKDVKVKVKFGEVRSEPFAARVFWALGYNLDPVDYVPHFRFRYDRSFFTDFSKRKHMDFDLTLAGKVVHRVDITGEPDPFSYIREARLKDGKTLTGAELRVFLLRDPAVTKVEASHFDEKREKLVASLETIEAQLQLKDGPWKRFGPWDWGDFDHADRRELRGLLAASAWLGWTDCRFDNNRTALPANGSVSEPLRFVLSDVGSVLGRTESFLRNSKDRPSEMANAVTRRLAWEKKPVFVGYSLLDPNPAFERATMEDVRWGLRWLMRLTPEQLKSAAVASGFAGGDLATLLEKLERRRASMWRDFR